MKRFFVISALTILATSAWAEESAQSTESSSATTIAASESATTFGPLQDPEASIKSNWSFSALTQLGLESSDVHYSNSSDKSVEITNAVGIGYKLNKENRLGLKQYFTMSHDGQKKKNTADMSYPVLTYGHTFKGVAKSDPVSVLFWYYVPVTATDYKIQNNGILRMDAEFNWTLSPKWSVSYYLNPRQTLIPTATSIEIEGNAVPMYAKSTLIHYGNIYYSVNDVITYYLNAGFRHDWKTSDFALVKEQYLTNLGANFSFLGGKFSLSPEIDYAVALPGSSSNFEVASAYNESNLSYVLSASVVF